MSTVVVVGSGAAGLTAALGASLEGAEVVVVEATDRIGGTTALSGGVAWLPGNYLGAAAGFDDTRGEARRYLEEMALGDVDWPLVEVFLEHAGDTVRWLEENSPLRWQAIAYPDYHDEKPGGKPGGRAVEPVPFAFDEELEKLVRAPLSWRLRATQAEQIQGSVALELSRERETTGVQTMGSALIGALARALLARGVQIRTSSPVTELVVDPTGRVSGVRTDSEEISGTVVLATGGFERDPALCRAFLRFPEPASAGAPYSRGDGLRMAQRMGAQLGNMSEAWWAPVILDGVIVDGEPLARLVLGERGRPGSVMLDRSGRRFCNEASNYNDLGRAMQSFNAEKFAFDRSPAWLVVDAGYRERYPLGAVLPGETPPADWLTADSVEDLADQIGADVEVVAATLARFAGHAATGVDTDHCRGDSRYDRFVGDADLVNPSLRALEAPFVAVPVHAGTLGTKGGPRTDGTGAVLDVDGHRIEGLYAAGNVAASPLGMAYPGAGGTIGPMLVFGRLAGAAAAGHACSAC